MGHLQLAGLRQVSGAPDRCRQGPPAYLDKRRLIVLLISAVATEVLFVAIAAYVAAILYHQLILLSSPDPARYIPEALLIAALDLLVSIGRRQHSQIQRQRRHAFLWNGDSGVFLVFFFLLSTMFVLKHSEDYSRATVMLQAASVSLAVLCARTIWFSLLQRAIALGLVDARRIILIGEPGHCSHFAARAMAMSQITQFGNMVTMRILQSPISRLTRAIKRAFDVATATDACCANRDAVKDATRR